MERIVKAVEKVKTDPQHAEMLQALVRFLREEQAKHGAEGDTLSSAMPRDLIVALGGLFLLGANQTSLYSLHLIEEAANLSDRLRDIIEEETGKVW